MKELFNLPKEGIKALLNCNWITYLYHLVYLGVTSLILFTMSIANVGLGGLIGYLIVVAVVYVLLTSFLLRLLTGDTGPKKTAPAKKSTKQDTETKEA